MPSYTSLREKKVSQLTSQKHLLEATILKLAADHFQIEVIFPMVMS